MMTAFAGHLSTEEVLLLWDRIIGFNSLEVLPGGCTVLVDMGVLWVYSTSGYGCIVGVQY